MSWSATVNLILFVSLATASADEPAATKERKEDVDPAVKEVPAKKKVDLKAQRAAQQEQVRKQYRQQYRPIVMAELERIRLAGEVPSEKRPLIKKVGEDAVEEILDALLKPAQQPAVQRLLFGLPAPVRRTVIDPFQRIEAAIDAAAAEHLTAEHLARYHEERAKRNEAMKQTVIKMAVFRIDASMPLSSDQRSALVAGLNKEWKPEWVAWFAMSQYGGNFVPSIPSTLIEPLLSPAQAKVWKGVQKMDAAVLLGGRINGAQSMGWNFGPHDDYWGKEPEAEQREVAPAAAAAPAGG